MPATLARSQAARYKPLMNLATFIRDIPDWPQPGVTFKDITPLLASPPALAMAVEQMANPFRGKQVDVVVGAESRGFIFGTAVAQALSAGFVPIRKPNKLPYKTHRIEYQLEYGTDALEIHQDAVQPGQRVLVCDDVLATGGTGRSAGRPTPAAPRPPARGSARNHERCTPRRC
jgi:adenine phosphoribosyltransferase